MDMEVEDVADKAVVDVGPNVDMQLPRIEQEFGDTSFSDDIVVAATHPLCLPVVSSLLFDYLDVAGIKTARLVCKAWADTGNLKLIKKATLLVHGDKNLHSFTTILGQTSTNRFEKYKFTNVRVAQFNRIFRSTGHHIKAFLLAEQHRKSAVFVYKVEFLRSILLECSNLEELDLFCSHDNFWYSTSKLWQLGEPGLTFKLKKATLRAESGIRTDILMALINACPNLRSFNILSNRYSLPHGSQSELMNLGASGKVSLENLDELNFGSNFPLNNHTVKLFRVQKLNLSKLKIALNVDCPSITLMDEMLKHLSETLTSFACELCMGTRRFPLVFPANMTRLATVEITTDNNLQFMDPIISASKLPNLKTLLLLGVDNQNPNYCQVIRGPDFGTCWRQRQLELDATNRCTSLRTLQIPGGLTSGQVFGDMAEVFPNVTDLRLQNPSLNVIAAVFSNYSNLERLSIKVDKYRIWVGLKDMKNLKYFDLQQQKVCLYGVIESNSFNQVTHATNVGDSHLLEGSLLHGLQYLTRAVQIDLQDCEKFSKEAIEELKSALGPCCFVNIST